MNILKLIALGLVLVLTSAVRAEEVGSVTLGVTENGVAVKLNAGPSAATPATPTAKEKWEEAERRREARQDEAARRAGLGFWEARQEDVRNTWNGTKWVSCKLAEGAANADGYLSAGIAVPTGYVAGSAFSAAASCAEAAASIK